MITDDVQTSREERCFRMWINSLGISTHVNNLFEDVRNGYVFHFLNCIYYFVKIKSLVYA